MTVIAPAFAGFFTENKKCRFSGDLRDEKIRYNIYARAKSPEK